MSNDELLAAAEKEASRLFRENLCGGGNLLTRLIARVRELEAIIDKHGKVGRDEFEEGCRRETVKEFGSCGWAERIAELIAENERLRQVAEKLTLLDWCIGYELVEANHEILDDARNLAFSILHTE